MDLKKFNQNFPSFEKHFKDEQEQLKEKLNMEQLKKSMSTRKIKWELGFPEISFECLVKQKGEFGQYEYYKCVANNKYYMWIDLLNEWRETSKETALTTIYR